MKDTKILKIYDKVYGEMVFADPLIAKLINTLEFKRLNKILQHSCNFFLTNNDSFSRSDHCLGVAHLAVKFFEDKKFAKFTTKEKREIIVACLLHDIGHGPLSHAFEKMVPTFVHEEYSVALIKNPDSEINKLLITTGLNVDLICDLILGKAKKHWAQHLISGQLDFDRIDYLLRDKHFSGWKMNPNEAYKIISGIIIVDGQLVFEEKILNHIERFLVFRFYIYEQIHWGWGNFFFETAIAYVFERLREIYVKKEFAAFFPKKLAFFWEKRRPTIEEFLQLTDVDIIKLFQQIRKKTNDPVMKDLLAMIFLKTDDYDIYFSNKPDVIAKIPVEQKKYYQYKINKTIDVYYAKDDEIKIKTRESEIKKLSEVATFFKHNIVYRRKINLFLDPNKTPPN